MRGRPCLKEVGRKVVGHLGVAVVAAGARGRGLSLPPMPGEMLVVAGSGDASTLGSVWMSDDSHGLVSFVGRRDCSSSIKGAAARIKQVD
jgi:hypothetical protein